MSIATLASGWSPWKSPGRSQSCSVHSRSGCGEHGAFSSMQWTRGGQSASRSAASLLPGVQVPASPGLYGLPIPSLLPPYNQPPNSLPTTSRGLCPILGIHSPKSPPPSVPSCPCSGCGLLESPTSSSRSDKSVQGPRRLHPGAKLQFSLVTSLVFASL